MSKNQDRILWIIISVLLATMLWFYVTIDQDPQGRREVLNVPITYVGENVLDSRDLSVIPGAVNTVNMTFTGRRNDLAALDNTTVTAEVDVSQILTAGTTKLPYKTKVPASVEKAVSTVGLLYPFVDVFIDKIDTKVVEVRSNINIATKDGFIFKSDQVTLEPHEVRVKGPASLLQTISYAEVVLNRADAVEQTVDATIPCVLRDTNGSRIENKNITIDSPEIHLVAPVHKTRVVQLEVEFRDGGGITNAENVTHTLSPSEIFISGDAATLDGVNVIKVGQIDLSKVPASGTYEMKIVLPNGCENLSGVSTATVDIQISGVATRALSVNNIEYINADIPAGYRINLITKEITVQVRGTESVIGLVNAFNVRAVVDLQGQALQPGQLSLPANIYIDGYSRAGAVGEYRVALEVVPITNGE